MDFHCNVVLLSPSLFKKILIYVRNCWRVKSFERKSKVWECGYEFIHRQHVKYLLETGSGLKDVPCDKRCRKRLTCARSCHMANEFEGTLSMSIEDDSELYKTGKIQYQLGKLTQSPSQRASKVSGRVEIARFVHHCARNSSLKLILLAIRCNERDSKQV